MDKGARNVKKSDVYTNIISIYYLSKVMGLAPLSLTYTHDKASRVTVTLKTSIFGVLYNLFLIIWIIGAQCYDLASTEFPDTEGRTKKVMVFESVIYRLSGVTNLAMSVTRIRKEMEKILYKMYVVDNLFDTTCDTLTSNQKCLLIQIVSLTPIILIIYVADILAVTSDFSVWTLFGLNIYVCSFIKLVTIIQFVNLTSLLRQKFQILNSCLASPENPTEYGTESNLWETLLQTPHFGNEDNWKDDALQMEEFYQALNRRHYINIIRQDSTSISMQNSWLHKEKLRFRALRIIWDVLCDVSSSVNAMYGLQILLCITSAFIKITANLSYSIISINANVSTDVDFNRDVLLPIIWALMEFLLVFSITATCSAATGEANRSVTLLQKLLLLPELHPATAAEIHLFLQQVRDLKLRFTAWDVFPIYYTLLGSTVGAVTTFLVMLLQFQADQRSS
jgi:hypothetical protein